MDFAQLGVAVLGGSAVWLIGRKEHWKRWGYILGMLSQPFWVWSAWTAGQWGILLLTAWYTYAWWQGIYNYWIRKDS